MSTLRADLQIAPQELYTSSSTQGAQLGSLATTGDGRYFRYALAGATSLVAGQVYCGQSNSNANWNPSGGLAVGAATATGATQFNLNSSITLSANDLAGGVMSVVVTPGIGQTYKVKSNTAVAGATGCTIVLEDPLVTNLSTASRVVFYPNPYASVVVLGTTALGPVVGVAVYPVTNAQYGWLQTRGPAGVYIQAASGTPAPGFPVGVNLANTTGALSTATGFAFFTALGTLCATGVSGEYDIVNLNID